MLSFFPLLISFNGLSGMSSLTNEQIKRIEENRAKALAKLAKKRATTNAPEQGNAACSSKTHLYHSSNVNKGQIHVSTKQNALFYGSDHQNNGKRKETGRNGQLLSGFYDGKKIKSRIKNVNDVLGKKSVVSGCCVLIDRTRFKVVVGFNSKLIGVLKTLPSKYYGKFCKHFNIFTFIVKYM